MGKTGTMFAVLTELFEKNQFRHALVLCKEQILPDQSNPSEIAKDLLQKLNFGADNDDGEADEGKAAKSLIEKLVRQITDQESLGGTTSTRVCPFCCCSGLGSKFFDHIYECAGVPEMDGDDNVEKVTAALKTFSISELRKLSKNVKDTLVKKQAQAASNSTTNTLTQQQREDLAAVAKNIVRSAVNKNKCPLCYTPAKKFDPRHLLNYCTPHSNLNFSRADIENAKNVKNDEVLAAVKGVLGYPRQQEVAAVLIELAKGDLTKLKKIETEFNN